MPAWLTVDGRWRVFSPAQRINKRPMKRFGLWLLALLSLACADGAENPPPPQSTYVVRDSAGVTIAVTSGEQVRSTLE